LSADVRLSTKAHNILEKDGNTLYVKGTTDNLYHAGEVLETYLNELSADYTLTESQSTDPQYKSVYNLVKNGTATGATIKIPKAMTIKT
jgi:hypothetical protein